MVIIKGGVKDTRLEAKAKNSPSVDRPSRGNKGQECSRPRPKTKDTAASVLQKRKKVFKKFFQAISKKKKQKRLPKYLLGNLHNLNNSKNSAILKPMTGQFSRT